MQDISMDECLDTLLSCLIIKWQCRFSVIEFYSLKINGILTVNMIIIGTDSFCMDTQKSCVVDFNRIEESDVQETLMLLQWFQIY